MMGKKKRSINREKFGNYGRSSKYQRDEGPTRGINSTELRELCVENDGLLELQSALKKRKNHG